MENRLESKVSYEINLNAVESEAVQSILSMGSILDRAYKFPSTKTTEAPMKELAYGTVKRASRLVKQAKPAFAY